MAILPGEGELDLLENLMADDTNPAPTGADTLPAAAESTTAPLVPASADTAPPDQPTIEVEGKKWSKGAVIVANGAIPKDDKRPVIIVETRGDDGKLDAERKYPTKGDLYYRTDPAVDFGGHGPVITLGVDVRQGLLWGFSNDALFVNVGPASPVYAAANLAYLQGATDIEIVGLTDAQKEHLAPWFAALAKGGPAPVAPDPEDPERAPIDVRVPADCKITLR